ncbi:MULTISPECIES: SDR family NAD(P)-dependent oxidoreductase [unclassified Sphingomonas]|uniref:SDR family NAD(P)-dependent oxidoreductase n=1 Tax=unclassified Sphingomonas TaxID=196159 RepID=UPI0006F57A11|nr:MULTISPECIES: SDR family oxidoreductase [unclassified Sphingomonas]KQX18554.1 short-chain dehydrogenase [Sphingomonas sp. Root1294]KQY72122.1 short-chain dehydrogenase [Sphingomonas sp. Root50]KRB94607.1 short-chain dehydrogenase [Sphingomonas sp. Root720]
MSATATAVVTGGSAGIGLQICQDLLDRGYEVISLALEESPLRHKRLTSIAVDLSEVEATRRTVAMVAERGPTTIICNAGVTRSALLEEVTLDDLDDLVNLYFASTILLAQACLPAMKASRFGRIVMISSRAAVGLATRTVYTATKSGLIGLARTWALELGPVGITVNVVAPGPVPTQMFTDVVPTGSERERKLIESLPVRRLGTPADIARAVLYFADPLNGFVTGQTLFVCGGASVGYLQI